jgi:hypothetical protein
MRTEFIGPPSRVARRTLVALAVMSWPLAGTIGAQTPQTSALSASVSRIADSAHAAGLPTEPLFAKAAEGTLKGADDARILAAVHRLARELAAARGVLGSAATGAELVAGASALHAGVPPSLLARVARASGERGAPGRLVMPLVVLADMVARHVSPDVAVSSLEGLVRRSAADAELATLRAAVERDIANGEGPDAATRTQTSVVLHTLDPRPLPRPPQD